MASDRERGADQRRHRGQRRRRDPPQPRGLLRPPRRPRPDRRRGPRDDRAAHELLEGCRAEARRTAYDAPSIARRARRASSSRPRRSNRCLRATAGRCGHRGFTARSGPRSSSRAPRARFAARARTKPKVTTAELARKYPTIITVDRAASGSRCSRTCKKVKTYKIAVGAGGLETPAGHLHDQRQAGRPVLARPGQRLGRQPRGQVVPPGPDNPIKARWMGFFDGAGIHGTDRRPLDRLHRLARLRAHARSRT